MDTKPPKKVDGRKNNGAHLAKARRHGRAKGVLNKETSVKLALTRQGVREALETGLSPMQVMINAMRDPDKVDPRSFAAAVAVAPYVHPKLIATAYKNMDDKPDPLDLAALRKLPPEARAIVRAALEALKPVAKEPPPAVSAVIDMETDDDE